MAKSAERDPKAAASVIAGEFKPIMKSVLLDEAAPLQRPPGWGRILSPWVQKCKHRVANAESLQLAAIYCQDDKRFWNRR